MDIVGPIATAQATALVTAQVIPPTMYRQPLLRLHPTGLVPDAVEMAIARHAEDRVRNMITAL